MNIVGTPYNEVQRSSWTDSSTASGSNDSDGTTMQAPRAAQARMPPTCPKQW